MSAVLEPETRVEFEATPVQQRLIDALLDGESRIIGFGGGIRGTKTWGSLAALIALCRIFPGSRWAVIRKDLQRLRDTTIPSFDKLRTLTGSFVGQVNQSTWNATCANGSQLLFRGENIDKDPELLRFHGYEVNGFLNEEADELSERTVVKEIERAGTWIVPNLEHQPPAYILNTFNPCGNWPRRRFYVPWRDGTITPPYAFIPSTAADNPYISDAQREAWREMPEHEYKRFVLGDWETLTGAYYDTLDPSVLIDPLAELPSYWNYWGSYDWGYAHWAVMGAWATDTDGVDYLLDTVWVRRQTDDEQANAFTDALPVACLKTVYAGHDAFNRPMAHHATGESVADVFAKRGIVLTRADIDRVNGGRAVNRQLKQRMVKIVKTPGNVRVYDQLGAIVPDENDIRKPAKVDADPVTGLGGDDGADMFRYGIATRVNAAQRPAEPPYKEAHVSRPIAGRIKDGKLLPHEPEPKTIDELVQWAQKRKAGRERVPMQRERVPRW